MKLIQNCQNCKAKKSLLIIFNRKYYYTNGIGSHKDQTTYYICKKCGFHQKFNTNDIISHAGVFRAYFVQGEDKKRLKGVERGKDQCIFCKSSTKPPIPAKNEIFESAILKLFVKPKKRFLGYFCKVCRCAYYLPIRITKWEKGDFFEKGKEVDLLNPLTGQLPLEYKEKHPKWNETKKLIVDKRYLDCIGNFITTEGFSLGEPDMHHLTIQVPEKKVKQLLKYLKKHRISVIR